MYNYFLFYSAFALIIIVIFAFVFFQDACFFSVVNIGGGSCACFQGYGQQGGGSHDTKTDGKDGYEECGARSEYNKKDTGEAGQSPATIEKPLSPEEKGDACQEAMKPFEEVVNPDQEKGSDKNSLNDQDKTLVISALEKATNLSKSESWDPEQVQDILKILEMIGKPTGTMLVQALWERDPSKIAELLPGVVALDQIIELSEQGKQEKTDRSQSRDEENTPDTEKKAPPLVMKGLPLGLLFSAIRLFTDDRVFRWILGFIMIMYSDIPYLYQTIRDLAGCSLKRIYEGQNEVKECGFLLDLDRLRDPGAGNIGIVSQFREAMLPIILSLGISMEEISKRAKWSDAGNRLEAATEGIDISKEEVPGTAQPGGSEGNKEAPENEEDSDRAQSPVNTGEASEECDTVEFEAGCFTINDVQIRLSELHTLADEVLRRMAAEIKRKDSSCSVVLESNKKEFSGALVRLDEQYNELREAEGTLSKSQMSLMCSVLLKLIAKVESFLKNAQRVFSTCDKNEATNKPYYVDKEMRRVLSHAKLQKELGKLWPIFRQYMTLLLEKDSKEENATEKAVPPSASGTLHGTLDALGALLENIGRATAKRTKQQARCFSDARSCLYDLRQILENLKEQKVEDEDSQESYCILFLLMTIRRRIDMCLKEWEQGTPDYTAARNACALILQKGFMNNLYIRVAECLLCFGSEILKDTSFEQASFSKDMPAGQGNEDASSAPDGSSDSAEVPVMGNEGSDCAPGQTAEAELDGAKEKAEDLIRILEETIKSLVDSLENITGKSKRGRKKKAGSTADGSGLQDPSDNIQPLEEDERQRILSATEILNSFRSDLRKKVDDVSENASIIAWTAIADMASYINNKLKKHLDKKTDSENGTMLSFSAAMTACKFITGPRFTSKIEDFIKGLEKFSEVDSWKRGSSTPDSYVPVNLNAPSQNWFVDDEQILPLDERARLTKKLWEEGKDPTDIRIWLEYIMSRVSTETFGTPTGEGVFCKLTGIEFSRALRYLTGLRFSPSALMRLIREDMKCHNRQAAKVDQIGEPHPLRNSQYRYIDACREHADFTDTLVISVDTKALILLGRLKHDNAKILCGRNAKHYKVNDHDFANSMSEIYPDGTDLVGQERMSENAVLKPVGLYCLNDGTGYISLVLGKDTAESMCNLIRSVIRIKKREMPSLKKVLILADGGGANTANGISWQNELLDLADREQMILQICHYSCGTSKHNVIEHKLFGPISLHWRGKPFLDIEHVASYISTTSLHKDPNNRVTCWFDQTHYMTNAEKKAAGQMVMTRKMLDKKAGDRIYHPFSAETDMYRWNYVIYPTGKVPETHDVPEFKEEIKSADAA